MGMISIEGMEFFAYHGCFKEERMIGNKFLVDLFLKTNTEPAESSDDLADTVDYQAVYGIVGEEMKIGSRLLEHVARRILNRLAEEFPQVISSTIKISKLNPPVGGKVERVCVKLTNDQ